MGTDADGTYDDPPDPGRKTVHGRHLQGPDTRIVRLWRSIASVFPVPSATLPRSMATVRHVGACRITGKKTNNHAKRAHANNESNFLVCHGD